MKYREMPASMSDDDEEDEEKKIYIKLSLAKYPFLKNKKVGEKGEANFKGEIETSEKQDKGDETYHTVAFQDLSSTEKGRRV